ncbi:GIY-YIG nuclease family protein [Parapedobacter sp. SGR-10]|uniref:GIY-YIG nuclease family protein n=1 Tax=Parapedobacter sp. SGR-10 TaxID=2710879 RepID=UPI0013D7787A|nr:GIY-YIG nuclease family protein [Parapedobacter sp. SGR-10]NGF55926.1 GIY-YIG nuclease family protein [Parapedobacter sp. SGR-10]
MERGGCVYIMTNKENSILYIGVTSDLRARVYEHKTHEYPDSFTAKYNLRFCVYYECFNSIEEAITREKQLKGWTRKKKIRLIESMNSAWEDLWNEIKDF